MTTTDDNANSVNQSPVLGPLTRLMNALWRQSSRSDFAISDSDLNELIAARSDGIKFLSDGFDKMIETTKSRQELLSRYAGIKFTSLGEDCFARTLLTRWGFKPPRKLGEKSGPFDLSVHPIQTLASLIESDFHGYLDPKNLSFSEKLNFVVNRKFKVSFNHETGPGYKEDNFRALIEAYERRLADWRANLHTAEKMIFVIHIRKPSAEQEGYLDEIERALKQSVRTKQFSIIVLNTREGGFESEQLCETRKFSDLTTIIDVTYPFSGYVWHRHAASDGGHLFERTLVAHIRAVVDRIRDDWNSAAG